MVYKKGMLVRVTGNTTIPRHHILPDTIAVVVEDCDSSKNANAVLLKGRWVKNPKKEIEQYVNVCDFVVLNQKAVYKKGTLVRVIGNTKTPRHYILPDTIAVVVEDCDSSKNANAVLVKGRWARNPKKEIEQYVNVCDFVVLDQRAMVI